MSQSAAPPPSYSPAYVNYVLGVVLLVMIFNIVDRTITAILLEDIKAELALSDRQLGVLQGPAFAVNGPAPADPLAVFSTRKGPTPSTLTRSVGTTWASSGLTVPRCGCV